MGRWRSIRARGFSIGKITESLVGTRGKTLFHAIIFFLIALAMGVFVHIVATLFSPEFYPESVFPSGVLIGLALAMGLAMYRRGLSVRILTVLGLVAMLLAVWTGMRFPIVGPSLAQWKWLLLLYACAASVLPVWLLLQPRDYVNSLLLYVGVGAMYGGFFLTNPEFVAPAVDSDARRVPARFDGRARLHGGVRVARGVARSIRELAGGRRPREQHRGLSRWHRPLSGGARTRGERGRDLCRGARRVVRPDLARLGDPSLRYNVAEIGETLLSPLLGNRCAASAVAVTAIWFFAFFQVGGEFAGLVLWQLFATTNQLMAGLALLAITLYLMQRGKPLVYTAVPMAFMLVSTLTAMASNLLQFWREDQWSLVLTGGVIFVLAVWLTLEAWIAVRRYRRHPVIEPLDVEF